MDDEDSQDEQIKRSATMGKAITSSIFIDDDSGEDSESFEESGSESEDGNGEDNELECEEEEVEDYLDEELEKVVGGDGPAASNIAEAGSDEEGENCPICLNLFKGQLVGTPENCAHFFCIDCIVEWSKNANSCPVDRIVFNHICVRSHYGGTVVKKIPVENKCVLTDGDDDTTNCEVCGSGDREDRLLLCDGCDAGYHMECLNPPLNSVPVEEWFCPECAANSTESDHENVTEDEVTAILAEEFPSTSRQQRSLRTRAIARTQQSERVRATVNRNRIIHARRSQNEPFQLMESSLFDETIEAVVAGLSTVVYERPLHPRARTLRRRRKRRTGKRKKKGRKTVTGVKTKGWRTTKRRRRFKRKKRTLEKTSVTARTRIARSLGITKPIHGATIPSVYRSAEPSWGFLRADIGAPSLSIYGDPFALETSESEEEQPQPLRSPSPLSMKRRLLSHSALRSHQPVARPISVGVASRSAVAAESPQENEAAAVPDLLGSILSGQNFLMMNSNNVVISRDGSLKPKSQVTSSFHQSTSRDAKEGEMVKEVLQPGSMCSGASTSISNTEHSRPFCLNGHAKPSQSNTSCSSSLLSLPSTSETSPQSSLPSNSSTVSGNLCFKPQNANIPRPGLSKNLVNMRSQFSELVGCTKRTDSFRPSEHKSKHSGLSSKDRSVPSSNVPWKTPPKRLDIADFPRIPKLKNKGNGTDSGPGSSRNTDIPDSCISKLTGNRDGNPAATVGNSKTSDQQRGSSSGNSDSTSTSTYTSSVPGSSQGGRGAGFSIQSFKIKRPGILEQLGRPYYLPVYDPFKNKEKAQQKTKSKPLLTKKASTSGEIYDPFNPTGSDSSSPSNSPQRTEPATPVAETSKLPSSETKKTDSTVKDKLFATKQVKTSSTSASYGVSVKMRSIVSELYDNMGDDDVDGSDAEQEKVKQDTRASSTTDVGRIKPIVESFSAANGRGLSLNSRSVVEEGINIRNENETTFQLDEDFIRKVKNKISQKAIRSRSRSGSVSSSGKKHKKQKKSSVLKDSKMPRSRSKSPLPVYGEKSKIKRERSCSSGRSRSSSNEKHKKKKPKSKGKHKEKQSKRSRSKERKRSRSRSVSAGGFTSENSESKKKKKKRSRSREQSPSSSVERKKKKSKRGRSRERYNKFQFRSKEKKRSRSRTRSRERKKRQSRSTSRSRGRRSRSRERKQKSRSKSKDRKGSRFQDKSHYYEKKREVVYRSRSRSRDKKVFVAREKSPSPERKRKENYSVNQSWPREKIAAVKEKSLSPGRRESSLSSRSKSRDRKGLGMWEKSPSPEGKQIEYSFKIRSKSKERKEVTKEKSQSPERKAREVLLRSRAPARERREFGSREKSQSPEIKREDAYFKNRSESRERSDFASVERSQSPDLKNEDSPLKNKSWYRDIKVTVTRERSKSPENKDGEFPVRNVSWSRESKESRGKDKVQSTETECEETSVRRISLFRVGRESGTRGRSQSPEEGPLKSGPKSAEVKEHRTREKSRCFEESEIQETSHSPEVKTEDIPVRSVMWYKDSKDYAIKGVQSPEIKSEEISLRSQSGSREDKFKVRGSSLSPEVKREESQSRSGSKSRSRKKSKHREKSRTPERDKETCFSSITRCIEGSESFIAERSESPETKHDDIPLIGESDSKYENETIEDTQVCDETLLKSKLWFEDETESETLGSTYTSEVKSEDLSGSILWRGETEPETTDQSISADIKREESSFGSALESGEGQKSETDEIPHSPVLKDHQNKLESSCASADENKSQTREVQFSEQTNEERSRDDFEWLELDVVEPLPSPEKSNVLQKDATIVTAPVDEEGRNVLTEVSHLDVLSETTANDSVSTEEMYSMEYVNTDAHMSPEHANEASLIMPESIGSNICENVGFISSDAPAADITFCNRSSAVVASAEVSQESLGNYGSSLEFPQDSVVPQVISLPDSIYSPTDEEEEEDDITPDSSHVSILQGEERAVEEHAEGPSVTEEELEGDYGDDDDAAKAESEYGTQIPGIKSKALVKRVTWNLQDEDQEEEDSEKTTRLSFHKSQRVKEGAWKNMEPSQILNQVLFNEPAPTNYMIPQPMFPDLDSSQVYSQTVPLAPLLSASLPSCVPVSQPTAEYIMQGSLPLVGTIAGQAFTSEPVFQAVPSEPAAQSITTGSFEAKVTEVHLEEKSKNAEYMKKLQIQERAVEEVKLAIKPFYQNREITKDEYKDILRKAVQKICRSRSGEINPVKVANLVKAYVEKYKHMRKYKKTDTSEGSHDWRMYSENPEYSQTA